MECSLQTLNSIYVKIFILEFRRPRRLRRVYEVLSESTTSNSDPSDEEQDQNQESDAENPSGGARQGTSEVCLTQ